MAYQVLARKWRPRTFDEVVGQQGVTQTLRNAIAAGRIGQSFVFAGARGVGKTTTARILAKALNCVNGPTVDPCGTCDACVEIAEGRDLDVLEIDAATHTQVEKVREIIIEGLGIRPVRDRYKIFIIDEVHMLSNSSFNALLKSIEEPPPHVVFMMATTELHKIPDTIRSRSQEFEFRTIGTRAIADQLRTIVDAEGIAAEPEALQLLARAAEGSLRDAESALDQVIAFAGGTVTPDDVVTVLGLVGRDFLLDVAETVADDDPARVFALAAEAVERGLDMRLLCRELSRLARDLMLLAIDPDRADAPEFAPEGDVDRLKRVAARFSREDLLRGFDILARAEVDIRTAPQPRYHFEMALLKWIYARTAVPLGDAIDAVGKGRPLAPPARAAAPTAARPSTQATRPPEPGGIRRLPSDLSARRPVGAPEAGARNATSDAPAEPHGDPLRDAAGVRAGPGDPPTRREPASAGRETTSDASATRAPSTVAPAQFRQAFLEEVKRTRKVIHGTVVAQASSIELDGDTLRFAFAPQHRVLKVRLEQERAALEALATSLAGRRITIAAVEAAASAAREAAPPAADRHSEQLRERVLQEPAVQAMLDVFPAEIRDVEEIED